MQKSRRIFSAALMASVAMAVAACGNSEHQPVVSANQPATVAAAPGVAATGQPVVVQQQAAPPQDNSTQNMLLGGAIGYMLGSAGRDSQRAAPAYSPPPQVIERRTTVIREVPRPSSPAVAAAPAVKPSTSAPMPAYKAYTPPVTTSSSSNYSAGANFKSGYSSPLSSSSSRSSSSSASSSSSSRSYSSYSSSSRR